MKNDSHLAIFEIQEFTIRLKEEHESIKEWLRMKREEFISHDSNQSDPADVASDYEAYLREKREVERKQARLMKIENRLKNMSEFGYCDECGIAMEKERLKIDPTFEMCIDCSDIQAIKSKGYMK